jgi:hypothetical protein
MEFAMSFVLSYPVTRYKPSPIVDLCTKAERERLSPLAIKAFFKIMLRRKVRDEDARVLLGGISKRLFRCGRIHSGAH